MKGQFFIVSGIILVAVVIAIIGYLSIPSELTINLDLEESQYDNVMSVLSYLESVYNDPTWQTDYEARVVFTVKENEGEDCYNCFVTDTIDLPDNTDINSIRLYKGTKEIPFSYGWEDMSNRRMIIQFNDYIKADSTTNYYIYFSKEGYSIYEKKNYTITPGTDHNLLKEYRIEWLADYIKAREKAVKLFAEEKNCRIETYDYGQKINVEKFNNQEDWYYYHTYYRTKINVRSAQSVDNYQVKLTLNNTNFDYNHAKIDGSDIRFYYGKSELPYWIEKWNSSGESIVWFKANLSAGENTFYIYHGSLPEMHPIIHYRFDNNTEDSEGNYDATNYGGEFVYGKIKYGIHFNGSSGYAKSGPVNITNGLTLSVWFYPDSIWDDNGLIRIGPTSGSQSSGVAMLYLNDFSSLRYEYTDITGGRKYITGPSSLNLNNRWTHVVVVHKFNDSIKIYVNGELYYETSSYDVAPILNRYVYISSESYYGNYDRFNGTIDEVYIFNRSLTDEEVRELYTNGNPNIASESNGSQVFKLFNVTGIAALWSFDEGEGDTLHDSSPNQNDGTIYGATWTEGVFGKSLRFNGVNNYVETTDINSIELGNASFVFWINVNNLTKDLDIITKGSHGTSQPLIIWRDEEVGGFADEGQGNIDTISTLTYDGSTQHGIGAPSGSLNQSEWNNFAVVIDTSGNKLKIYKNGVMITEHTKVWNGIQDTTTALRIGDANPSSRPFDGEIDEVYIFNRSLTDEEVRELYNGVLRNMSGVYNVIVANDDPTAELSYEEKYLGNIPARQYRTKLILRNTEFVYLWPVEVNVTTDTYVDPNSTVLLYKGYNIPVEVLNQYGNKSEILFIDTIAGKETATLYLYFNVNTTTNKTLETDLYVNTTARNITNSYYTWYLGEGDDLPYFSPTGCNHNWYSLLSIFGFDIGWWWLTEIPNGTQYYQFDNVTVIENHTLKAVINATAGPAYYNITVYAYSPVIKIEPNNVTKFGPLWKVECEGYSETYWKGHGTAENESEGLISIFPIRIKTWTLNKTQLWSDYDYTYAGKRNEKYVAEMISRTHNLNEYELSKYYMYYNGSGPVWLYVGDDWNLAIDPDISYRTPKAKFTLASANYYVSGDVP
ncbi:MAG TPA: DUF2341 domain-containing protein [Candidatus Aenigmarchaeota archaeon]|nr:MAG: hypothetical protein DRN75_02060 [Nanoarchaeota archaeon]HDO79872.1 DUF2341 domain-containing protein [Candidatus Aenigmarchaeota archaeon]HEX32924.1 DUF2341 domain-containing protein [Candidatus Aenigmarchaeota archaeon]